MKVEPIGVIHSPFSEVAGMPIQPVFAADVEGVVEVFPRYQQGLKDIAGFERIWLVYWFHRSGTPKLIVTPFRDEHERGLFATRAPCRANPIGLSVVRLLEVAGNRLRIAGVDVLDGTTLLDIKPYVPEWDAFPESRTGWMQGATGRTLSDKRFAPG